MRSTILIVLLALLVAAPAAEARKRPHRMTFQFAVAVALDYWAKNHVTVPCAPSRRLLSAAEEDALSAQFGRGVAMATYPGTCEVLITPAADSYRRITADRLGWLYCRDVAHEVGHIAGLRDTTGGLMDPSGTALPWGCAHPRRFLRLRRAFRTGFG